MAWLGTASKADGRGMPVTHMERVIDGAAKDIDDACDATAAPPRRKSMLKSADDVREEVEMAGADVIREEVEITVR